MQCKITPNLSVGEGSKLLVIAGPCQIESLDKCLEIGHHLASLCNKFSFNYVFKASYDKANRTSLSGVRGLGIEEGLKVLGDFKSKTGIPVLTDIHTAEEAITAAEYVDVLQIPPFLCRQTDLLLAAGNTGKAVNVKKGQFLAPADMQFVAEKIASTGNANLMPVSYTHLTLPTILRV